MPDFDPALLREARELTGLTIGQLAERAGIHRVSLSRYENGLNCPEETWATIEKALRDALAERIKAAEKMRRRLAA